MQKNAFILQEVIETSYVFPAALPAPTVQSGSIQFHKKMAASLLYMMVTES